MMNERGPVGGAGELTALELAQRVINNFRQYAANGVLLHPIHYLPMAEALEFALAAKAPWQPEPGAEQLSLAYWREKLQAAEQRNIELEFRLSRAREVAKAPQGVPTRQQFERELYASDEPLTHKAVMRIFDSAVTAAVPSPVSDDTIHHGMVPPADEYNLRAYKVEGHWHVGIDIDKAHSGLANGVTLSEAMDSASEMLRHMRNKSIEEGRLPREAAAPKPAPPHPLAEMKPANRSLAEKAQDEMSEFEKGFPYDAATPAPGAERLLEALETIVAVASGQKQVADDDTAGMAWIDKFAREALAAAPPGPLNQRMWDLLRTQRAPLLVDELITEDEYAELAKDHAAVKRLEDYDASRHASAERVRELEQALKKALDMLEREHSCLLTKALPCPIHDFIAITRKRALPPSTGEKS